MITRSLYFLFFLFLPTQLGKHFFLDFSYINGLRVDYNAIVLYTTDILAVFIICANWRLLKTFFIQHTRPILLILILVFLNISISMYPVLAAYSWLKVCEVVALIIVFSHLKIDTKMVLSTFAIGALFELVLAFLQFQQGRALQGMFYFFGERSLSLITPGVAKAVFMGQEILRPYATFSHPNSMGGFYLLLYTWLLFFPFPKKSPIINYQLSITLFASALVFISFSKIVIVGYLLITGWYVITKKWAACKPCSVATLMTTGTLSLVFLQAMGDPFSAEKRITLFAQALETIKSHPFFGVGLGQYLFYQEAIPAKYADFFLQPVHNIFLLFMAQSGLILGGAILYLLGKWVWQRRRNEAFLACVFVVVFTGFFDHYWLTLQQNMLLVGVVFGLISSAQS